MKTWPMQPAFRLTLWLVPALGAGALLAAAAELSGLVARGAWLGEAHDAERWAALLVGAVLLSIGLSALPHMRLGIDDERLYYLGFGLSCRTRTIALGDVRRWGHAVGRNRGRREPLLLFELADGSTRLIKLAMYSRQAEIRAELERRLGPPTPTSATLTGARFDG